MPRSADRAAAEHRASSKGRTRLAKIGIIVM